MNEKLSTIKQAILTGIEERATSRATAFELRKQFLDSKTGEIGQLMKEMKNIAAEDRAEFGKQVNELKNWATEVFEDLDKKMKEKELKLRYEKEK
ncbi:MAG: phenylalanine--tRNA ligase subunit alpha, partial [Lachnospiraceae bacterium]|nr:phenylalanine--tRNA ligase subunit alpha [Lachnospiraceae bacterium]